MTLKGTLILNEQEDTGNYDFSISEKYMTTGFQKAFGNEALLLAATAVSMIRKTYPDHADHFQTFRYTYPDGTERNFWIIHDRSHYTVLLPEEY